MTLHTAQPNADGRPAADLEQQILAAGGVAAGWVKLAEAQTGQAITIYCLDGWQIEAGGHLLPIGRGLPGSAEVAVTRQDCLTWAVAHGYRQLLRMELPWLSASALLAEYARGRRDFRRVNLDGDDFTGKHLEGIHLSGSRLCWTVFRDAWLDGADLSETEQLSTDFTGCHGISWQAPKNGRPRFSRLGDPHGTARWSE